MCRWSGCGDGSAAAGRRPRRSASLTSEAGFAMPTVADLTADLDAFAPRDLAADWDNVGLLLGDPAAPVQRALTCLTVTPDVADEAVEGGYQLIVTHHPILFRGAKRLTTATAE